MKKWFSLVIALMLMVTSVCAVAEGGADASVLTISLTEATDEELADALTKIQQEIRSRIKTAIVLDKQEATIGKGKTLKIAASVEGLEEGAAAPKLTWSTSDKAVATVAAGTVTAVNAGQAVITCAGVLADGTEISTACNVSVVVAVSGVTIQKKKVSLDLEDSYMTEAVVAPNNATNPELAFSSDNPAVAAVDSKGEVKAIAPGTATIKAEATDGSGKSASYTVHVSSFKSVQKQYSVTEKTGMEITAYYYGDNADNIKVALTGGNFAECTHEYDPATHEITFNVVPLKAGTLNIAVTDKADAESKLSLSAVIEHSAVYDTTGYPQIKYEDAYRYPDNYKGKKVSFSGRVLQVMESGKSTIFRIASRRRYDDVVYVTIRNSDITTPILEEDNVTVFGEYVGNYTYTSLLGGSITIPKVDAERINLKVKTQKK